MVYSLDMSRFLRLLSVLVLLTVAQACGTTTYRPAETISLTEATAVLRRAEAFATAGDAAGMCSLTDNRPNCQFLLEQAGGIANAPSQSPTVVDSYILPSRDNRLGGRVLVLEGATASGEPFRTDFLVFDRGNNQLTPLIPVYWSGVGVGDSSGQTAPAPSDER